MGLVTEILQWIWCSEGLPCFAQSAAHSSLLWQKGKKKEILVLRLPVIIGDPVIIVASSALQGGPNHIYAPRSFFYFPKAPLHIQTLLFIHNHSTSLLQFTKGSSPRRKRQNATITTEWKPSQDFQSEEFLLVYVAYLRCWYWRIHDRQASQTTSFSYGKEDFNLAFRQD